MDGRIVGGGSLREIWILRKHSLGYKKMGKRKWPSPEKGHKGPVRVVQKKVMGWLKKPRVSWSTERR